MKMIKPKDVDSYIQNSTEEARSILCEIREIIKAAVPNVEEKISYNVPFYKYYGEFVGYAAYKKHVSFGFGEDSLQPKDREILEKKGYTLGKGTLQIQYGQKVPALEIQKIVTEKAKVNEAKNAEKRLAAGSPAATRKNLA